MIPRRLIHALDDEAGRCVSFARGEAGRDASIRSFCELFAGYIGGGRAVLTGSGREAFSAILDAMRLSPGDEVIFPAYTLADLAGIVVRKKLKPVFADIDAATLNIDPRSVSRVASERARVVVATHLFGAPCAIEEIVLWARSRSVYVIEDCAHCLGASYNGRKLGSFGDAAFFSFETIKPLNLYGGGMAVLSGPALAGRFEKDTNARVGRGIPVKKIASAVFEKFLFSGPLSYPVLAALSNRCFHRMARGIYRACQRVCSGKGNNFDLFRAYLGQAKLAGLDLRMNERRAKASVLASLLSPSIKPQAVIDGGRSNYYFFVALTGGNAWTARSYLLSNGIDAGVEEEIADDCSAFYAPGTCPVASDVFSKAIQLPLNENMPVEQLKYIADRINFFYSG